MHANYFTMANNSSPIKPNLVPYAQTSTTIVPNPFHPNATSPMLHPSPYRLPHRRNSLATPDTIKPQYITQFEVGSTITIRPSPMQPFIPPIPPQENLRNVKSDLPKSQNKASRRNEEDYTNTKEGKGSHPNRHQYQSGATFGHQFTMTPHYKENVNTNQQLSKSPLCKLRNKRSSSLLRQRSAHDLDGVDCNDNEFHKPKARRQPERVLRERNIGFEVDEYESQPLSLDLDVQKSNQVIVSSSKDENVFSKPVTQICTVKSPKGLNLLRFLQTKDIPCEPIANANSFKSEGSVLDDEYDYVKINMDDTWGNKRQFLDEIHKYISDAVPKHYQPSREKNRGMNTGKTLENFCARERKHASCQNVEAASRELLEY